MSRVKVFALQRSGTNYVEDVVVGCFDGVAIEWGGPWRHSYPHERRAHHIDDTVDLGCTSVEWCRRENVAMLVVRKDLDHWVPSIRRKPLTYRRQGPFAEVWRSFYAAWEKVAPVVRYEDFLLDFPTAVDQVGDLLGLAPAKYVEPATVRNSPEWRPEDRSRYV